MVFNDILIYIILISFFFTFANVSHIKKIIIILILSIICVYVEYTSFLNKQANIDDYNKVLYLIIDYIHVCVFLSIIFLISITIKFKCNINYLFILNIFAFSSILLFFYFKSCILTILMYKITNIKFWISPIDRLKYILGLDKKYNIKYRPINNNDSYTWINGQYLFMATLLLLNICCFYKKKRR
jgi:hypothetical protein